MPEKRILIDDAKWLKKQIPIDVKLSKKQTLINDAKFIIAQYSSKITLRQLFYRLVVTDKLENNLKQYKRLVLAMSDARVKTRQISFEAFNDLTRRFHGRFDRWAPTPDGIYEQAVEEFENIEETFKGCAGDFFLPKWHGQSTYVEVWCEKDALESVFAPICKKYSAVYGASRGQASLSWLYEASKRLKKMQNQPAVERMVLLIYVDFDPAGLDIWRVIKRHINNTFGLNQVEVLRMAVTEEQIAKYNIVPKMTKLSDSRYAKWVAEHGEVSCVELDAIEPKELEEIIKTDIMAHWDEEAAEEREKEIEESRAEIQKKIDEYFAEDE